MSQEIGRFAPDEALRRFEAVLGELHDPLRPLGRYVVTDNSQWSDVGASYVAVNVQGVRKLVIYRDGPRPAVGSALQCVRTGPESTAPWLAFPLPAVPVRVGWRFVFSASQRGRAAGAWHHALLGIDAHGAWGLLGPHPFTQARWLAAMAGYVGNAAYYAYPEYSWLPLARIGARLYAWALALVQNDAHPDGSRIAVDAPNCYVSDDGGLTWALGPLRGLWALTPNDGGAIHYAIADDGTGVYRTTDGGVSWALRATFAADNRVQSLSVDPDDATNLAVGAARGIATSADGGATWTVRYAAPLVSRPRDPRDNIYQTNPWTPQSTYPAVAVGRSGTRTVFAFTPDRAYTIGINPYIRSTTFTDGSANPYYHPELFQLGHVDDTGGGAVRDLGLAYRQPEDASLSYIANAGWATVAGLSTFVRRGGAWLWLTQGPRQYAVPQVPNRVVLRDPTGTGTAWSADLVTPGGAIPEDERYIPPTQFDAEVHEGRAGGAMGGLIAAADGLYLALSGSPNMIDDFPRDGQGYGFYPRLLRSRDDGATWVDVTGGDYRAALAAPDGSGGDYVLQPYGIARGDAA